MECKGHTQMGVLFVAIEYMRAEFYTIRAHKVKKELSFLSASLLYNDPSYFFLTYNTLVQ